MPQTVSQAIGHVMETYRIHRRLNHLNPLHFSHLRQDPSSGLTFRHQVKILYAFLILSFRTTSSTHLSAPVWSLQYNLAKTTHHEALHCVILSIFQLFPLSYSLPYILPCSLFSSTVNLWEAMFHTPTKPSLPTRTVNCWCHGWPKRILIDTN